MIAVFLCIPWVASDAQKQGAEAHLARALEACKCSRKFGPEEIIAKDWADLTADDMARLAKCGCRQASCEKLHFDARDAFTSAYFLELGLPRAQLEKNIPSLFTDPACRKCPPGEGLRGGGWPVV